MEQKSKLRFLVEYFFISVGCALMALSLNMFFIPNNIAPGGVSGIATVIYNLTGFPVGAMTLIINVPLFIIAYKVLGRSFGAKTLYATIILGVMVDFIKVDPLTGDILLNVLYGGVLTGVGLGIILKFGATTGGTDLAAAIINKYTPGLTIGVIMVILDTIVVVSAGFVSGLVEISLYSMITLYILVKFIDFMQEGMGYTKAFFIVSTKNEEISQKIFEILDRGATALNAKGMYSKEAKDVLLCVVTRPEVTKLKEIVKSIDDRAFIILTDVHEALGEGFKPN